MKNKVNLAIAFFALCQTMVLVIDDMKGTNLYKQTFKNLCNKILAISEAHVYSIYKDFKNKETEMQFYKTTEMAEIFVRVINNKNIGQFISLLKEYDEGNVVIADGNKHNKIIKQLPKL